jgi:hypothetical protein
MAAFSGDATEILAMKEAVVRQAMVYVDLNGRQICLGPEA